jgi:hypothetical protein
VRHSVPLIYYIEDGDAADRARVMRLATGIRVEPTAIEVDTAALLSYIGHHSTESGEVAVLVVEALRHSIAINV